MEKHTLMVPSRILWKSNTKKNWNPHIEITNYFEKKQFSISIITIISRFTAVDDNLTLWEEMKLGTEKGQKYCVRAKIDYESTNRCMRDPTIYRWKPEHHPLETNTRCILRMILPVQFFYWECYTYSAHNGASW